MISKEEYEDLKEYWDYQRKVQYNKETVFAMADKFNGRVYNDFGPVDINTIKEQLWVRVRPDDYEEPYKGWVPEDEKLRFEWEDISKSKLKPDDRWKKLSNELEDYIQNQ